MLVLTRKERDSVVLADEITVTVEKISDTDGQRISGGRVRLGFQCPGHVSVERSEYRARVLGAARSGESPRPAPPPAGTVNKISDAQVRLRIRVPRRVPVCLNGTPTVGLDAETRPDAAAQPTTTLYRITCRQDDRVTICKNIMIAPVAFHRFEFSHAAPTGSR